MPMPTPRKSWRTEIIVALIGSLGVIAAAVIQNWPVLFPPPEAQIVSFTASPLKLSPGGEVTLSWQTRNAGEVRLDGIGTVPASGQKTLTPGATTAYTLIATNSRGRSVSSAVQVEVGPVSKSGDPSTTARNQDDLEDPKVAVERLAAKWTAAYLRGDADMMVSLSSEPFYFDRKIVLTRDELKDAYLKLYQEKGASWQGVEVGRIKVQTVRELQAALQASGRDINKDRIFANLNLSLDDYAVTVVAKFGGREEGLMMMVRKAAGKYEVAGIWD